MDSKIQGDVTAHPDSVERMANIVWVLPREEMPNLEKRLAKKAGVQPEIDMVYELDQLGPQGTAFFWFTDTNVVCADKFVVFPEN